MSFRDAQITDRQREIISYIGRGYSFREIGQELGIVESTVKGHATAARWTLGVAKARRLPEALRAHDNGGERHV